MKDDTRTPAPDEGDAPKTHADLGFEDLSEDWQRQVKADRRQAEREARKAAKVKAKKPKG